MKLKIGEYEVDIKARNTDLREKMNPHDAMAFLLNVAVWARGSAQIDTMSGYHALADEAMEAAENIHDTLEVKGYFDQYK